MFECDTEIELLIETLTGASMDLRISPFATVLDVKELIQQLEGIPVSQQSLVWRSVELDNDLQLIDYKIHSGATLTLVLSMRGGPINARRVATTEEPSLEEIAEYFNRDEFASSSNRLVIVYQTGDKLNFFRLVDRDTASSLSYSLSGGSDYYPEEEYEAYKQRWEENDKTRDKMKQLRRDMKNASLAKVKRASKSVHDPRPLSGSARPGSRVRLRRLDSAASHADAAGLSLNPHLRLPPVGVRPSAAETNLPSASLPSSNRPSGFPESSRKNETRGHGRKLGSEPGIRSKTRSGVETNPVVDPGGTESLGSVLHSRKLPGDSLETIDQLGARLEPSPISFQDWRDSSTDAKRSVDPWLRSRLQRSKPSTLDLSPPVKQLDDTDMDSMMSSADFSLETPRERLGAETTTPRLKPSRTPLKPIAGNKPGGPAVPGVVTKQPIRRESVVAGKTELSFSKSTWGKNLTSGISSNPGSSEISSRRFSHMSDVGSDSLSGGGSGSSVGGTSGKVVGKTTGYKSGRTPRNPAKTPHQRVRLAKSEDAETLVKPGKEDIPDPLFGFGSTASVAGSEFNPLLVAFGLMEAPLDSADSKTSRAFNADIAPGAGLDPGARIAPDSTTSPAVACIPPDSSPESFGISPSTVGIPPASVGISPAIVGISQASVGISQVSVGISQASSTISPQSLQISPNRNVASCLSSNDLSSPPPISGTVSDATGVAVGAGGARGSYLPKRPSGSTGVALQSLNHSEVRAMSGMLSRIVRSANRQRDGYLLNGGGGVSGVATTEEQASQTIIRILSGSKDGRQVESLVAGRIPSAASRRGKKKKKSSASKRCAQCGKRISLTTGFPCRCGGSFCATHRYAELHDCTYDYKAEGRKFLEQANPVVAAPKLPKI